MKKGIVHEAVNDVKELSELAVDAAMGKIVESVTPAVRALIEKSIRGGNVNEDLDRLRRAADGYGETEFEEGTDKGEKKMEKELDMEALMGMFPGLSEIEMDGEEMPEAHKEPDGDETPLKAADGEGEEEPELESAIPTLGEAEEEKEGDMDEEIEISEAELRKVYEASLKQQSVAEAMVSKGFKDMTPSGEIDEVDPGAGIADVKSGESQWDEKGSLPPARKDWTVKEVRQLIRQGLAENKKLREMNSKLLEMLKTTTAKLNETNLFNAKVLHVNKLFSAGKLTKEQKKAVVESIDAAVSVNEVKKIALTLEKSFKSAGLVNESVRKPKASSQGARTSGGANQKVLRESADKSANPNYSRWAQLAGLCK